MSFFSKFPLTTYDINKDGKNRIAVDIIKRVIFRENIKENSNYFQEYTIEDGETPEMVAHKFYGATTLHWIILLMNQITDPFFGWPLDDASLSLNVEKKYPGKAFYIETNNCKFQKNEEVRVNVHDKRHIRGLVKEWDPTYRKLVLYNTYGKFETGQELVGMSNNSVGSLTRLVDIHMEGVHHFEDNDGNTLNPLATPPVDGVQVVVGQTGDSPYNEYAATFDDSILWSYVTSNDGNVTTHKAVTNFSYEYDNNERKREIKMLKMDLVDTVVDDFNRVMR